MAKNKQSKPTTVAQETNVDLPEVVNAPMVNLDETVQATEQPNGDINVTTVVSETKTDATPETTTSIPVEEPVIATVVTPTEKLEMVEVYPQALGQSITITEVLPPVAQTKTVEVETVIVPVVEEKTVVVDKEFLYRMLVGLSRGHVTYYTYAQVTGMVGKLFGVEGTERQAKWDEIKEYIQKR